MTRQESILNAMIVFNYLAEFEPRAYVNYEVTPWHVNIHFYDPRQTDYEVSKVAEKLSALRLAGTDLQFLPNENNGTMSIDIYWRFDRNNN